MKFLVLIAMSCLAVSASAATLESTSTWISGTGFNDHTYSLFSVQGGIDWADAESNAVALGGTLATITSADENNFVFTSLNVATTNSVWTVNTVNSSIGPWLGGLQAPGSAEPGGFQWVTGEPFSYTNWSFGEPSNSGGTEDRIEYFGNPAPNRTSSWNDVTGTITNQITGYIVEVVPEPTAISFIAIGAAACLTRRQAIAEDSSN